MVKEQDQYYVCEECKFKYETKDLAEKCEAYCKENNSCNLDIISKAVQ